MKTKTLAMLSFSLSAFLLGRMAASTVNFSGVDLTDVSSPAGQTFAYTVGAGPATGTVNVRLLSGDASAVAAGASPDTTGFDAQQIAGHLTPAVYEFTLSAPQSFIINQNESLTTSETNGFTLKPSGAWTVLSSSSVTTTVNGSMISFLGAGGANQQPPYGNFSIQGAGATFDFTVTNAAGLVNYGSALSLNITGVPEPGPLVPLLAGGAAVAAWLRRRKATAV